MGSSSYVIHFLFLVHLVFFFYISPNQVILTSFVQLQYLKDYIGNSIMNPTQADSEISMNYLTEI